MKKNNIKKSRAAIFISSAFLVLMFGLVSTTIAFAPTPAPVDIGSAKDFAVLAGAGITNTGSTTIGGDVGTHPTITQTGFSACPGADCVTLTGTNHVGDATTQGAKTALTAAYIDVAGRTTPSVTTVTADLNTMTPLLPGIYKSASSIGLTGTITLDAGGNPDAVFIFQAGSSITTATDSVIQLTGQAQACNVFWTAGSSATLGTSSTFVGTILADQEAITVGSGANINGRLLANIAAVTLINNTITVPNCKPHLTVIKNVVGGGPNVASDFPLFVGETLVTTGQINSFTAGSYVVSETSKPNYTQSFSDSCTGGNITLVAGQDYVCTITNTYQPVVVSAPGAVILPMFLGPASVVTPIGINIPVAQTPTPVVNAVQTPKLPDTGFAPRQDSKNLPILVPALGLVILAIMLVNKNKLIKYFNQY